MEETRDKRQRSFFAAANSGYGFYSFYENIFEDRSICERYIIKGGPGTGKSRFMKELAFAAREAGISIDSFCCSSDPSSLDGVTLDLGERGRICVLDGTAPHIAEASLPGARDTILNFCDFWDSTQLKTHRDEIFTLSREKQAAYLSATDALRSLLIVKGGARKRAENAMSHEKVLLSAKKLMADVKWEGEYFERTGLASSFGMFGPFGLATYKRNAKSVIAVDDSLECAHVMLSAIVTEARQKRIPFYHSYTYLDPHKTDAVLFPMHSLSFVSTSLLSDKDADGAVKKISMSRFFEKGDRSALKGEQKELHSAEKELMKRAEAYMAKMRDCHFKIEEIYISAMDFERKEAFCREFIKKNVVRDL